MLLLNFHNGINKTWPMYNVKKQAEREKTKEKRENPKGIQIGYDEIQNTWKDPRTSTKNSKTLGYSCYLDSMSSMNEISPYEIHHMEEDGRAISSCNKIVNVYVIQVKLVSLEVAEIGHFINLPLIPFAQLKHFTPWSCLCSRSSHS